MLESKPYYNSTEVETSIIKCGASVYIVGPSSYLYSLTIAPSLSAQNVTHLTTYLPLSHTLSHALLQTSPTPHAFTHLHCYALIAHHCIHCYNHIMSLHQHQCTPLQINYIIHFSFFKKNIRKKFKNWCDLCVKENLLAS